MSVAEGIDVSGWQHPGDQPINWAEVAKAGKRFCIVKATQGTDTLNEWLHRDASEAHAAGLLVGAYHYAVPGDGDAALQANYFVTCCEGLELKLGYWLDLETYGSLQVYQIPDWAQEFLAIVKGLTGVAGIYSNAAYLTELPGLPWGHPLWLAFSAIPPGVHPDIHQGEPISCPGISGQVDPDVLLSYRGIDPGGAVPPVERSDDVGVMGKDADTLGPWYVIGGAPVVKSALSIDQMNALSSLGYQKFASMSTEDLDAIPTVTFTKEAEKASTEAAVVAQESSEETPAPEHPVVVPDPVEVSTEAPHVDPTVVETTSIEGGPLEVETPAVDPTGTPGGSEPPTSQESENAGGGGADAESPVAT